jgi:two-component sensor histidine kinase
MAFRRVGALRLLFAAILAALGALGPARGDSGRDAVSVLLLHSHYQGYSWTDAITEGVSRVLGGAPRRIDLSVAYLDSRKTMDADYEAAFESYLRSRYSGKRIGLVIASDNEALVFLARHGPIFPGVPVVFCGINDYSPSMIAGIPEVTGVTERVDMLPTVLAALQMRPRSRRVAVFACDNQTAQALEAQFRTEVVSALGDRIEFVFYRGLSLSGIAEAASSLDGSGIVVLLNITRDSSGATIAPSEAARVVSESSRDPVFSFWDFYLGYGIVGGRITSGKAQGEDAAALALRVLAGERASSIPVMSGSSSPFVFDYRAMRRYGIKESSLPPDSEVVGRPDSFFRRHASVLVIAGAVIAALAAGLALVTVMLGRQRKLAAQLEDSRRRLLASLAEKEILLREVHHRVKNNMQVVASLLRIGMPEGSEGSDGPCRVIEACRLRVETMSLVYEELYGSDDFSGIDIASLTAHVAARIGEEARSRGIALAPPRVPGPRVSLDRAVPCALVAEELVANAFAHAFPDGRTGTVSVRIEEDEDGVLRIAVEDDGAGHPEGFDLGAARSIGYVLVRALAEQLSGRVELRSGPRGSSVVLEVPAAAPAAMGPPRPGT